MSKNTFEYNGQVIEFDTRGSEVMVNATQMAKIYGRNVHEFLRNEQTKSFIATCLKSENSRFLNVNTEDDIVTSKQKSGTFMHRVLALKFAAWLNPDFELWVYSTIDDILFGSYREMEAGIRASAERAQKMKELEHRLRELPDFAELERLKLEERQAKAGRSRIINTQLRLFIDEE